MKGREADLQFVWHPFTQMRDYARRDPVVIESGQGVKLRDTEGKEYFDGVSSLWVNVHGHQVPEIDQAIRDQLKRIAHSTLLGQASLPSVRLAEKLVKVSPRGLRKVFYSDSGATAVEIAMKMAIQYRANRAGEPTPRQRFLTFRGGYHGDTFGPMSVVPDPQFHWPFKNLLPEPIQVDFPYPPRWSGSSDPKRVLDECLEQVESQLRDNRDVLAGVMVEPVQGAGGMIPPPSGFLTGLRALTREYDVLLIVDEVATGFGRVGSMFACDREGVSPDIMALGKGLTGGYLPVAATLATRELYEAFLGSREQALLHGHSFTGNALGCAAALASLERLQEMLPELPEKIQRISTLLEPLSNIDIVADVRQAGFMCGVELMKNPAQEIPFRAEEEAGWTVCEEARTRGMLLRPLGDVVVFMPPQASTPEELNAMVMILREAIRATQNRLS